MTTLTKIHGYDIAEGTITGDKIAELAGIDISKIEIVSGSTPGNLILDNSNLASVPMSGDATINVSGVVTIADFNGTTHGMVPINGSGEQGKVLSDNGTWITAAFPAMTDAQIIVASTTTPEAVTMTGDVAINNAGVTSIADFNGSVHGMVPVNGAGIVGDVLSDSGYYIGGFSSSVNGLVPAPGTVTGAVLSDNGTWVTQDIYSDFNGTADGGLVPINGAGIIGQVLSDNGTWVTQTSVVNFDGTSNGIVVANTSILGQVLSDSAMWVSLPVIPPDFNGTADGGLVPINSNGISGRVLSDNGTWITAAFPIMTATQIIVGAYDGTPTAQTMSGDATLNNVGVITVSHASAADSASNVIFSGISGCPDGEILIGQSSGNMASYPMSGDVSMSDAGVASIADFNGTTHGMVPVNGAGQIGSYLTDSGSWVQPLSAFNGSPGYVQANTSILGQVLSDSGAWITVSPVINFADNEVPSGTVNGTTGSDGNNVFALAYEPVLNSEHLFKNGLRQLTGVDYTISDYYITFASGNIPIAGDNLVADYRY